MKRIALLAATAIILACCSEETTGPSGKSCRFMFRVKVVDSLGEPVSGLRVSARHRISIPLVGTGAKKLPDGRAASVSIPFELAEDGPCEIAILDLEDSLVRTIVYGVNSAGAYTIIWDGLDEGGDAAPEGVYRCRMRAGGRTWYRLIDYYEAGPGRSVLGFTNEEGELSCRNRLLFPGTYTLPPMVWTDICGDSIGTFTCLDSVNVILADTLDSSSMIIMIFSVPVLEGSNTFQLEWDPDGAGSYPRAGMRSGEEWISDPRVSFVLPDSSGLGYPYPNPFY